MRQYGKLRYVSNNTMITPVVVSVSIRSDVHLRPLSPAAISPLSFAHRFLVLLLLAVAVAVVVVVAVSPVSFSRPLPPRQSSRWSRTCVCIFRDAKIDTEPCVTVAEFHGRGLRFGRCFDRSQCGLPTLVDNPWISGKFCPSLIDPDQNFFIPVFVSVRA